MELNRIVEAYVLGTLSTNELPVMAADVLEAGYDSPSLRMLAGLTKEEDTEVINRLFREALQELEISIPQPSEAGLSSAHRIANEIVSGTIPPYEGAKQIWREVYTRFPELAVLKGFVGLASEYEDDEEHREQYAHDIVLESKNLLAGEINNAT